MRARRDERGFALLAVLLVLAMLGVLGAEFAYSMRLEASAVRSYKDGITAGHLAEAAIAQAIREIATDWATVVGDDQGELTFYTRERIPIPAPERFTINPWAFPTRPLRVPKPKYRSRSGHLPTRATRARSPSRRMH